MNDFLKKTFLVCVAASFCMAGSEAVKKNAAAYSDYESESGKISYSTTYAEVSTLMSSAGTGKTPSQGDRGKDGWRQGLVTGNGENGVVESCGPAEDVMIFQNIKFTFPTNAVRVTPDTSSVREEAAKSIISYNDEYLSALGAQNASNLMVNAATEWVKEKGLDSKWNLQNTYAFHPAHQLRLKMDGAENGSEKKYVRYTNYQTGEIGTIWTDDNNNSWERKTFTSRVDNANITELKSTSGAKINMTITVDDIAKMSNEGGVGSEVKNLRYRKIVSDDYIGWVAHYPEYPNSTMNNGGFAGVTRVIVSGDGAGKEYVFGTETADTYKNPVDYACDTDMNVGLDKAPSISITDADAVYLITKTDVDTDGMGTIENFVSSDSSAENVINGRLDNISSKLIDDTSETAKKYSTAENYSDFNYEAALEHSAAVHGEMFNRLTYSVCTTEQDKAMRSYTNEELIAAQKNSKTYLLPAMLERLFYNGRYAAICSSGIGAPRLGGMWTGAWNCEWSGDYTTDANINLQIAGANIGSIQEETLGFMNVMVKNLADWELNARQFYGIENAVMAPTRTDGVSAAMGHFNHDFPGQMWLSGASWLIFPIYEYYQCYGNVQVPLTDDIREELEFTGNKYAGYGIYGSDGEEIIYNLRNALDLSDERAEEILASGYLDLERDILYPMLTKTANFWLGFVSPKMYTKDGVGYYDDNKTELAEDEYYLIAPAFSPENTAKNNGKSYTANATMDIASTKSALEMAIEIENDLNLEGSDLRIESYNYLLEKLPPYLYESSGELKEWALYGYEENYGHRHGSQLYGVWPAYESEADTRLFAGAEKLIKTKNSYPNSDNKTGHGWLHRGLVMARLKNGEGVKETLIPLTVNNMLYNSMMMAHNNDMSAAYCTDPVITIPAIELETLIYSDENTIELLPAMLPELENGGSIGGTAGSATRNGGIVSSLEWTDTTVKAVISNSDGTKLKLKPSYDKILVDGEDVTSQLIRDDTGESYYLINTDDEINVEYAMSEIQSGTFSINNDTGALSVNDTAPESEVSFVENLPDARMGLWNITGVTNDGYKFVNTYTGKVLTADESGLKQAYYSEVNTENEKQIWKIYDGKIISLSGYEISGVTLTRKSDTDVTVATDSITISAESDKLRKGNSMTLKAVTVPFDGISSGIKWSVDNEGMASISERGVLTAKSEGIVKVTAKAKHGQGISNTLTIEVIPGIDGFNQITKGYYTVFGRQETSWEKINVPGNAFDGNSSTWYDGGDGGYCGVVFNDPQNITAIRYMPRSGYEERMTGTKFQVSADGENYTTVYTVSEPGTNGDFINVFTDDLKDEVKSQLSECKYFRFYSSDGGYANVAEIELYTDELKGESTEAIIGNDISIWADDILESGGSHQGSNGDTFSYNFGSFINTDEKIKQFFPNAEDGKAIGEYTRLNAIDNDGGVWEGYVEAKINASSSNRFKIYLLCNTQDAVRKMQLTNTTNNDTSVAQANGFYYSTDNYLQVMETTLLFEEGENIIKIQAPSGEAAPNFIALKVIGAGDIPTSIDLSECRVFYVNGEKAGASYCDASGTASYLYDGDVTTASNAKAKTITFFDVSKYASYIKRIEYSINGADKANANFLYGSGFVDSDISSGAVSSVTWDVIYRTNGTVNGNVTVKESTINTETGTGTAVLTGDFSSWRYIGVANGSTICGCSELKLYLNDEGEENPTEPPTATPDKYEIISADITTSEATVINSVLVRAENECELYIAEYDQDGVIIKLKIYDVQKGEHSIKTDFTSAVDSSVKAFLWKEQQPLSKAKEIQYKPKGELK